MGLIELETVGSLTAPALIVGFDGWVNAGSAATAVTEHLVAGAVEIGRVDPDEVFDFRATRPTADFQDGVLTDIAYPDLTLWHRELGGRDLIVLTGTEASWRWRALARDVGLMALELGIVEHLSLGGIPWAIPHTRPTTIIVTASQRENLPEDPSRPEGLLRVPASLTSAIEHVVAGQGIPARGFWARVPQYVGASYLPAAVALLERVGTQLGVSVQYGTLVEDAAAQRVRIDEVVAARPDLRALVEQLEAATEAEEPSGEELAAEIERFLQSRDDGDDEG